MDNNTSVDLAVAELLMGRVQAGQRAPLTQQARSTLDQAWAAAERRSALAPR
ncbi:MAG TPA: hypothetical protein VFL27_00165 [Candidatus Dormibacteraeota bacterium]|nr:hypothetical protein [Candidatus Dormibacteraeota bacterium]